MFLKPKPLKYWFILIFAKPGQGKSLEQARLSEKIFKEYKWIEKNYPKLPRRILMTNQLLNDDFFGDYLKNGQLKYWERPDEFRYCPRKKCWKSDLQHENHDVDIFIDEGATLFPADNWQNTPIWLRKMWMQHRHNGIRCVMLTQNYNQIDINARRVFSATYMMEKRFGSRDISPTLPPVPFVFGIYTKRRVDPDLLENNAVNFLMTLKMNAEKVEDLETIKMIGFPEFHLITRHKVKLYDTTQNVKTYEVRKNWFCVEDVMPCGKVKHVHKFD